MDLPVRCECGRLVPVPETAAGATHLCECGRTIAVPSLSELKRQCGLPAYSPPASVLIPHMIADGELPLPDCVGCGEPGEETIEATAKCERSWKVSANRGWWLGVLVFGVWAILLRDRGEDKVYGRNLDVRVPFRLCRRCPRPAPRTGLTLFLRVLKFVVVAAGIVLAFAEPVLGAAVIVAGLLLWWAQVLTARRAQAAVKRLLRRVPIYGRLLDAYPDARVVWDERSGD